jgi:cell division GTPase FtsZ
VIYGASDPDANIIFGTSVDETMDGDVAITVVAAGFPADISDGLDDGSTLPPPKKIYNTFNDAITKKT